MEHPAAGSYTLDPVHTFALFIARHLALWVSGQSRRNAERARL